MTLAQLVIFGVPVFGSLLVLLAWAKDEQENTDRMLDRES